MAQVVQLPSDAPLNLPVAVDSQRLVRARGAMFLVTTSQGDVTPAGARELGLFYNDTRFLSYYQLEIASCRIVSLGSDTSDPAYNQIDLMLSDPEREELLEDPSNFLHIRRRQVLDGAFVEEIVFTNFLLRPVEVHVVLHFAADFADVFEVRGARRAKRGQTRRPRVEGAAVVLGYGGLCGRTYESIVSFGVAPSELLPDHAVFDLHLPPNEKHVLDVRVVPVINGVTRNKPGRPFHLSAQMRTDEAKAFRARSTRFTCDSGVLQGILDQSCDDMHDLRVEFDHHAILGAGIPWFCCPFGRDSLIASYEALTYNPDFSAEALRTLAAYQGKKVNPITEEEPGKIFHELRFGEMAAAGEIPHSPYYGSIDATPLFVVLADAHDQFTGDTAFLHELRPAIEGALAWIDARSDRGTRLVTYERRTKDGLLNQGWKDSGAGVSFPDGRRAEAPIALIEVQGYCADAYKRGANVFRRLGEVEKARVYDERAATLRELLNETFWMEEANRYAYAVDGRNRLLPTIVSNAGHLLWSGVVPADRATATAGTLLASSSFSGFGIRTLAADQPVYNPLSYHNGTVWPHDNALIVKGFSDYGLHHATLKAFDGLYAAMGYCKDQRLPELFCGMGKRSGALVRYPVACSPQAWASAAPFLLVQSILGIEADAPGGRLTVKNPRLPPSIRKLELKGMRVGAALVDIGFRRVGKRCHVDRLDVTGGPLRTAIHVE
jgi:glycogen debranching enzyme